jgi:hypothetical protein
LKCLVHQCENHDNEGGGRYLQLQGDGELVFFCIPCWAFITCTDKASKNSQVARNGKELCRPNLDKLNEIRKILSN